MLFRSPVKLAPNTSKIVVPAPIIPVTPIAPILKASEPKATIALPAKPIVPIAKPIEIKPDLKAEKKAEERSDAVPEKAPLPNSASRRTIQEKLPAFIGPGKKIGVKPAVVPVPPIVIAKPVESKASPIPKIVKSSPVIKTDQKSSKTAIELPKADSKTVEPKAPDLNAPKKGNWFDRFRKSDEPTADLSKDSTVKKDVPISSSKTNVIPALPVVPLPIIPAKKSTGMFSSPVLELTKDQKLLLSTQKDSAIETRKPFNLFGSGKKAETPNVKPIEKKPIEVTPVKPIEVKPVKPIEAKPTNTKSDDSKKANPQKSFQFSPGKKVDIKPAQSTKPNVIVKDKIQNTVKPIERTPIVKPKPEVVKPEVAKPKPENQTESKSTTDADSMKSLVDRLNKIADPTPLKADPIPPEPSVIK